MCKIKTKAPKIDVPPSPAEPALADPTSLEARDRARKGARRAAGRSSTLRSGPQGISSPAGGSTATPFSLA